MSANSYEFFGRIKFIGENPVNEGFRKREFVLVTDEQYPQMVKFELQNDKVNLISPFFVGEEVRINFNIRGREWIDSTGKTVYFTSFVCWRIQKVEGGYVVPKDDSSPHVQHNYNFPPSNEVFGSDDEHDDLPF